MNRFDENLSAYERYMAELLKGKSRMEQDQILGEEAALCPTSKAALKDT